MLFTYLFVAASQLSVPRIFFGGGEKNTDVNVVCPNFNGEFSFLLPPLPAATKMNMSDRYGGDKEVWVNIDLF